MNMSQMLNGLYSIHRVVFRLVKLNIGVLDYDLIL